ncbi:MAG TPA: hypothetical protein VMH01_15005 [Puia sp.]|nr:hypothetical protein [Puia sp.]
MKPPTVASEENRLTGWRYMFPFFLSAKNNREPDTFPATGCWVGNISGGEVIGIVNQPDGKSIFYSLTGDPDSSVIVLELQTCEGEYSVKGETFQARYSYRDSKRFFQLNLEGSQQLPGRMSGIITENGSYDSTSYSRSFQFEVTRQL